MTKILYYLQENQKLNRLRDVSSDQVKNAFMANLCASLVLLKIQDLQGLYLINDLAGTNDLTKFNNSLSDVNFWARILFHPTSPAVKSRLQFGHAELLNRESGRISSTRMHEIIKIPTKNPNQVNWDEVVATLFLLRERYSIRSTYLNNIIKHFFKWSGIFGTAQKKAINDSFMYLLQSDPSSALLSRMRALSNNIMTKAIDILSKTIIGFKRLNEDDGGVTAAAESGTISTGEIASNTTPVNNIVKPPNCESPYLGYKFPSSKPDHSTKKKKVIIKDGKIIKKKVKGFSPRMYKAPDHIRVKKIEGTSNTTKTTFKDIKG